MAPITERMFFDLIDNVVTYDIHDDVKNLDNCKMLHIRVENFFHKFEEVSKSVGIYDLKPRLLYAYVYMLDAFQVFKDCSSLHFLRRS